MGSVAGGGVAAVLLTVCLGLPIVSRTSCAGTFFPVVVLWRGGGVCGGELRVPAAESASP